MRFRHKVLLCMVWTLTLAYSFGGMALIQQSFRHGLEEQTKAATTSYRMVLQTVELVDSVDLEQNLSVIAAVLRKMDSTASWSALRLWDGETIYYCVGDGFWMHETQTAQQVIFTQGKNHYLQISSKLNEDGLQLDIVYPLLAADQMRHEQLATYRRFLILLLTVGGALSYWMAVWMTKPLSKVSAASRKLAQGDLSARADVQSFDEVGLMAQDFNAMAEQMQTNVQKLTDAMQQQEQFMGSFAHELKTPMTAVIGYADILRGGGLDDANAMEAANYIYSEGKRLERLSMKLLQLFVVKNQTPTLIRMDLCQLLQSFESDALLHLPNECYAMVEPDLFRSLVQNLIDNARKAQSTEIVIQLQHGLLTISDNGNGIPPDALFHLTEPFYRVDKARSRSQGGSGLGLALCERIARIHGTTLQFASEQGKGTTVSLQLMEVEV